MWRVAGAVWIAAAACTSTTTVSIDTDAAYVRYREGDGAWRTPTVRDGSYELEVAGDYEVVAVEVAESTFATELFATLADGAHWTLTSGTSYGAFSPGVSAAVAHYAAPCFPNGTWWTIGEPVTGQFSQLGTITVGTRCVSPPYTSYVPWTFDVAVDPGAYDVIAVDAFAPTATHAPRIAITRDVTVTAATTLPPIDLDQQGTLAATRAFTIANTGDAITLDYGLELFTGGAAANVASRSDVPITAHDASIYVVPDALLSPTDSQVVVLTVESEGNEARAYATAPSTDSVIEFLSLPAVSYAEDGITATWSDPLSPRVGMVDVDLAVASAPTWVGDHVSATTRWLSQHRATSLAFDASPPDFNPSWLVPTTAQYLRTFAVRATEDTVAYDTWTQQDVTP